MMATRRVDVPDSRHQRQHVIIIRFHAFLRHPPESPSLMSSLILEVRADILCLHQQQSLASPYRHQSDPGSCSGVLSPRYLVGLEKLQSSAQQVRHRVVLASSQSCVEHQGSVCPADAEQLLAGLDP